MGTTKVCCGGGSEKKKGVVTTSFVGSMSSLLYFARVLPRGISFKATI